MPHVPNPNRSRTSHRFRIRNTHDYDAYASGLGGGNDAAQQSSVDEVPITPVRISVASFAAGIQPVLLVSGLPTLPNVGYPIHTFVYDIAAVPPTLYKNVADVWTKAIGPDDIQANSITAGQIAAGAVSTSELAVGARLTGEVANETGGTPGVFIDTTGILVRDGKLTIADDFGTTVFTSLGYDGAWRDFMRTGIFNGTFSANLTGVPAMGRTSDCPYWTLSQVGTPTWSVAEGSVRIIPDTGESGKFRSDRHQVGRESRYRLLLSEKFGDLGINTTTRRLKVYGYTQPPGGGGSATTLIDETTTQGGALFATYASGDFSGWPYIEIECEITPGADPDNSDYTCDTIVLEIVPMTASGLEWMNRSTSFPASPATNDLWFRTDLGMMFQYNGTRWLCTCLHTQILRNTTAAGDHAYAATTGAMIQSGPAPNVQGGSDIWIEHHTARFFVNGGTALSGSHSWVGAFRKNDSAGTLTSMVNVGINSGASSTWRLLETSVGALLGTTFFRWGTTWTKTGTPGDLSVHEEITYRIVAT